MLSKVAKCLVPYSFETKNQEKMKTIYDWLDQADRNSGKLEAVWLSNRTPEGLL